MATKKGKGGNGGNRRGGSNKDRGLKGKVMNIGETAKEKFQDAVDAVKE